MRSQVINPFSLWNDLKKYRFNLLKADLYSGLSVALLALPQAMAYAFLANLPPSAGIWSAVFGTIFTAAFGHSRSLVSGPTNTVAILIQSGTSVILYNFFRNATGQEREELALNIVLQLVLMIGIFQILGGFLRLGKLAQFTSRSVITGYMAGAGIAIAVNQLFPFFGIHSMRGYHPIYLEGWYLLKHLKNLHIPTTLLAAVSLGALAFFYRRASKIPIAAIVIFFASLIVFFLRLAPETAAGYDGIGQGEGVKRIILLKDLGPVFTDLPMFSLPDFDLEIIISLVPLAGAIAFISMLEVTAIGRTYSPAKESDYKDSQELFGLGVSNLLSGFFGGDAELRKFFQKRAQCQIGGKNAFFIDL